jgi:murein DD-endopeptidase MepM/ murein hydrolase activator NlpD
MRQGDASRIAIRATAPLSSLRVSFAGHSWPAYAAGLAGWRTVLGTDPTTTPGRHTIVVEATARSGVRVLVRRQVTVLRVAFPTRRITFDPETASLLTPENVERERRRVRQALREVYPTQLWDDPLLPPLEVAVSSPYGVLSFYQGQVRGFHAGADFPAPEGTPVRAAATGIVRLAESLPLSGNAVFIDHGIGVVTTYQHLSEISVGVDQRVRKGEVIGRVGSTGLATGPHLHWGLRVNGVRVDPMPWTAR